MLDLIARIEVEMCLTRVLELKFTELYFKFLLPTRSDMLLRLDEFQENRSGSTSVPPICHTCTRKAINLLSRIVFIVFAELSWSFSNKLNN